MPFDPVEFLLAGRLLKKAQHFIGLEPLTRGDPARVNVSNPALVTELLNLMYQTAPNWVDRVLNMFEEMADRERVGLEIPQKPERARNALLSWVNNHMGPHIPVVLGEVPPARSLWQRIKSFFDPYGVAVEQLKNVRGDWIEQLEDLSFRQPMPPNLSAIGKGLTHPEVGGVAYNVGEAGLTGVQDKGDLFAGAKVNRWLLPVLLHEYAHLLVPRAKFLDHIHNIAGRKFLNVEATNIAASHIIFAELAKELAQRGQNPFSAQILGQLARDLYNIHTRYLRHLQTTQKSQPYDIPVSESSMEVALLPSLLGVPAGDSPWWKLLSHYAGEPTWGEPTESPRVARARVQLLNNLAKLLVEAAEPERAQNLTFVDLLQGLQYAKTLNPELRRLYEMAAYGPTSLEELKTTLDAVAEKYPHLQPSQTLKELRRAITPSWFRLVSPEALFNYPKWATRAAEGPRK